MTKRLLSEAQASKILQRAALLQEADSGVPAQYSAGVTEEDLLKIGAEAGIDPGFIQKAMREVNSDIPQKGFPPLAMDHEVEVEGHLDPEDFDVITEVIRPIYTYGGKSTTNRVGRTFEVMNMMGTTQMRASLSSRHGRTKVVVRSDTTTAAVLALCPPFFVAPFLLVLGDSPLLMLAAFALLTILGIALIPLLTRKGHQLGSALADQIADRVAEEMVHSEDSAHREEEEAMTETVRG